MAEITVYSKEHGKLTLIGPEKTGGEGAIYLVKNMPGICAKIYFSRKITREIQNKVEAMIKNPPGDNLTGHKSSYRSSSISWPLSSLYSSDKKGAEFRGFTMPLIDTSLFRQAHRYYDPDDRLKLLGGSFSWLYLLTAAFNIAFVVSAIHKTGHRIGDMSASNILVARTAAVSIIDCDSFQIEDAQNKRVYYTKVATGDFLPPELMGKNFRDENIDRYHSDLFALGILIFKILMNGYHPYQARGNGVRSLPTIEQKIIKGYYPYSGTCRDVLPPKNAPPVTILSPDLRKLFERCFVEGHKNKNRRPSASEWAETLKKELSAVKQCRNCENHWYSGHLGRCPWCIAKKSDKNRSDPFPPNTQDRIKPTEIKTLRQNRSPAKIYTPHVKAAPKRVDLKPVNSDIVSFALDIENTGDGILKGYLKADRQWIKIKKPDFSTAKSTRTEILVDKTVLPDKSGSVKYAGNILISSNGGSIKVPVTVASGTNPKLGLSAEKILLRNVKKKEILKKKISVANEGNGFLKGTLKSGSRWLKISDTEISTFSGQNIEISVDTDMADSDVLLYGKIEIETNGGNKTLTVAVSFAK